MRITITASLCIALLILSACGGGGGSGGGGGTADVLITTFMGNVYQVSNNLFAPAGAPDGYAALPGSATLTFTSTNGLVVKTATVTTANFSLSFYTSDGFSVGQTITGTLTLNFGSSQTASGPVSIDGSQTTNSIDLRVTSTDKVTNDLVAVPSTESAARSCNIRLYYYNGTTVSEQAGLTLFMPENGHSSAYSSGGITFSLTQTELNELNSGVGNIAITGESIFGRKTIDTGNDQSLVIIECGDEDFIYPRLATANELTIYKAFRELAIENDPSVCRTTLGTITPAAGAETTAASIISSLSWFRSGNWAQAEAAISPYKSDSALAACTYANTAVVTKTTASDFGVIKSTLDNNSRLPSELYFSDGHALGLTDTAVHTLYAIAAFYSGNETAANQHLAALKSRLDSESGSAFSQSAAKPVYDVINDL